MTKTQKTLLWFALGLFNGCVYQSLILVGITNPMVFFLLGMGMISFNRFIIYTFNIWPPHQ